MKEEYFKDSPVQNVSSQKLSRTVGHPNLSQIFVNGLETKAVIDTGSIVSNLYARRFVQSLQCKLKLHDIKRFELMYIKCRE